MEDIVRLCEHYRVLKEENAALKARVKELSDTNPGDSKQPEEPKAEPEPEPIEPEPEQPAEPEKAPEPSPLEKRLAALRE